uniref:DUF975 family protein n=1 Tax=Agathobacter sp. TaxID=2021311 RepID=UPI004055E2D4
MRLAADFRGIARDVLDGKWKIAVLVGLVATILGAVEDMGPEVKINIDMSSANASFEFAGQTIFSTGGGLNSDIGAFLVGGFTYIMIAALIMGAVYFILGSIIKVGYAKFNLNLVDRTDGSFENLFAYFSFWKTTAAARFLQSIYVLLWSLLFIVPGIIASYSYAMTEYVLADHPELSASEALSRSKQMMDGNKWRLFCLQFSFIGWDILCAFTLGIGNLWLTPYKQAATAVFYREVSGTEHSIYQNEWTDYTSQMYEEM